MFHCERTVHVELLADHELLLILSWSKSTWDTWLEVACTTAQYDSNSQIITQYENVQVLWTHIMTEAHGSTRHIIQVWHTCVLFKFTWLIHRVLIHNKWSHAWKQILACFPPCYCVMTHLMDSVLHTVMLSPTLFISVNANQMAIKNHSITSSWLPPYASIFSVCINS